MTIDRDLFVARSLEWKMRHRFSAILRWCAARCVMQSRRKCYKRSKEECGGGGGRSTPSSRYIISASQSAYCIVCARRCLTTHRLGTRKFDKRDFLRNEHRRRRRPLFSGRTMRGSCHYTLDQKFVNPALIWICVPVQNRIELQHRAVLMCVFRNLCDYAERFHLRNLHIHLLRADGK